MDAETEIVMKKSLLCIVPLPPPITGAAIASETVVNYLKQYYDVVVMPYQRGNLISGRFSIKQLLRVFVLGFRLRFIKKHFDSVYLVISSTFWGHARDVFLSFCMGRKLRKNTIIHLHSAVERRYLKEILPSILRKFVKKMFNDFKNGIVTGDTWKDTYMDYISIENTIILKNCFAPYLMNEKNKVLSKFDSIDTINILFLSNMIKGKGYEVLLHAFLSLPESITHKVSLNFAGKFNSNDEKKLFLEIIKNKLNVFYHGIVVGEKKRQLLWDTHIFCFPTFYKYETQGIVILEAYASGCIVLTTDNGGIKDICQDGINGFLINMDTYSDTGILRDKLREKLEMLIMNINKYKHIAIFNLEEASEKYTEKRFCKEIERVLLNE